MNEDTKYGGFEKINGMDVIIMYNGSSHLPIRMDMDLEEAIDHMIYEDMFFKWVGDNGSPVSEEDFYTMSPMLFGDVVATLDKLDLIGPYEERYLADGTKSDNQEHITEYAKYLMNAHKEYKRGNLYKP